MNKRVVITGIGVVSSIGINAHDFWTNLIKGKSGISNIESADTSGYPNKIGGEIRNFLPEHFINRRKKDSFGRASQLGIVSSRLALEDAGIRDLSKQSSKSSTMI